MIVVVMANRKPDPVKQPRPLGRYVETRIEEKGWTLDDLVQNARRRNIRASTELFRKARYDGFVQPLRVESVEKLAAGLETTEDHIRALDAAFWYPNSAPVGAGVDPEVLALLADFDQREIERVKGFLLGIKEAKK